MVAKTARTNVTNRRRHVERQLLSSDGISNHKKRRKNFNYEFTSTDKLCRSRVQPFFSGEGRPDTRERRKSSLGRKVLVKLRGEKLNYKSVAKEI